MTHPSDLSYTSATQLARMIRRKELSPVELMDVVLARAQKFQPALNAFVEIHHEEARAAARAAEAAVMNGALLAPLHGVPISIKDNLAVQGKPMRNGSLTSASTVMAQDALVVERVKASGAIHMGTTTLPEFAHKVLTDSPLHGTTRNPYSLEQDRKSVV